MSSEDRQREVVPSALPPQDLEAEMACLGAALIEPGAAEIAVSILAESDFYPEAHRLLFQAIQAVHGRGDPVDEITVGAELRRRDLLERVGGVEYLTALEISVPTAAHVARYATLVAEKSALRNLIRAGAAIQSMGYDNPDDIGEAFEFAEQKVFEVTQRRAVTDFTAVGPVVQATFESFQDLERDPGALAGISTGLRQFDRMTSGLQPGELIILAGRPSMGKTSLAVSNFVLHAAISAGKCVGVFSLEMSKAQLGEMLLCAHSRINSWDVKHGNAGVEEWSRIGQALTDLPGAPIYIDDTPGISIAEVRSKARRLKTRHDAALIVVDYLQLVGGGRGRGREENRHQEISAIARSLKGLARELNVPVVVLSQLSRRVEQREDKRPILSDLAESGSIEAEADLVCFLFRPSYYEHKRAQKEGAETEHSRPVPSPAEIIIAKHRSGPVGTVDAVFHPEYRMFFDQVQRAEREERELWWNR